MISFVMRCKRGEFTILLSVVSCPVRACSYSDVAEGLIVGTDYQTRCDLRRRRMLDDMVYECSE